LRLFEVYSQEREVSELLERSGKRDLKICEDR
jgi:hypothetical protein